jgi:subtilisin family serine protease
VLANATKGEVRWCKDNDFRIEQRRDARAIKLRNVEIDTSEPEPPIHPRFSTSAASREVENYYIVQFVGPIKDEWKGEIQNLGGKLFDYVPNYGFIVRMNPSARDNVGRLRFVRWLGTYQPAYKLSASLVGKTKKILPTELRSLSIDTTVAKIRPEGNINILVHDPDDVDKVSENIKTLGGTIIAKTKNKIRTAIDISVVEEIAKIPEVKHIEEYVLPRLHNDVAAKIMKAPQVWSGPEGAHGLDGKGQIVAVADTGLDSGVNDNSMHADFQGKIVSIYSWPNTMPEMVCRNSGADDGPADVSSGHGTHVAGSILGNGKMSDGKIKGIAYRARLVFQAIEQFVKFKPWPWIPYEDGYYLTGLPADLKDLFQQAYDEGARIHSNSWGAPVNGRYDAEAEEVDEFVWNHKDMTILFSAGNDGEDRHVDGIVDHDSMGSPGTAKNCITVGASENVRLEGGRQASYGDCWPNNFPRDPIKSDYLSDNAEGMVAFSSRGPTDDGRKKPDVIAPGTNILSTKSSKVPAERYWGPCDDYYAYMGGTSMANPLAAGAATLVRQYYGDIRSHTPSAALVKATLINGATEMRGQYTPSEAGRIPNNDQGWGRVNLKESLFPSSKRIEFVDNYEDISYSLSTGESKSFTYSVEDNTVQLKVTLAWADYPGPELQNDLDLIVTSPSGKEYHGNCFPPYDGPFDRTNNVECIFIDLPETGTYRIEVYAHNIPEGPQDFALVISGGIKI